MELDDKAAVIFKTVQFLTVRTSSKNALTSFCNEMGSTKASYTLSGFYARVVQISWSPRSNRVLVQCSAHHFVYCIEERNGDKAWKRQNPIQTSA